MPVDTNTVAPGSLHAGSCTVHRTRRRRRRPRLMSSMYTSSMCLCVSCLTSPPVTTHCWWPHTAPSRLHSLTPSCPHAMTPTPPHPLTPSPPLRPHAFTPSRLHAHHALMPFSWRTGCCEPAPASPRSQQRGPGPTPPCHSVTWRVGQCIRVCVCKCMCVHMHVRVV